MIMRTFWIWLAALVVVTGCGSSVEGNGGSIDAGDQPSIEEPAGDVAYPSLEACGLADPWSMVETAFVGRVLSVEERVKDGRAHVREEMGLDPTTETWPWVTFEVDRWYIKDFGTEFSMWGPGFAGAPGEEWLVAGALYWVDEQSGEVFDCLTLPNSEPEALSWDTRFGGSVLAGSGTSENPPDPAVLSQLEVQQTTWMANRPGDYTVVMSVSDRDARGDECGDSGVIRVVVVGGVAIEAVDLRRGCFVEDATTVLLPDDLFDLAARAAGAVEGEISYDPVWGLIRFLSASDRSIELSLGADLIAPRAVPVALGIGDALAAAETAGTQWQAAGIESYVLDLEVECFCTIGGRFEVTVTDDVVTAMTGPGGPVDLNAPGFYSYDFTVEGLFDILTTWSGGKPDSVVAGYDPELGYPVDVRIDALTNAADDELTLIVRNLTQTK